MYFHDVVSHAKTRNPTLFFLFFLCEKAVHGGLWRCAYKVDSIGEVSALIYFAGIASPVLMALAALTIGTTGFLSLMKQQ
ncbi:hypothetical protein T492DRAFT_1037688 [Pavlovales sp. CCMP2436]|nr:hypothetical protein T492DRAFT_1037688 [Pavlovales sp. CCMP2436]